MIVHQKVAMTAPPKLIDHLDEAIENRLAVGLSLNAGLASITPAGHVIQGMFKLETKRAGHEGNLAILIVVLKDLIHIVRPTFR